MENFREKKGLELDSVKNGPFQNWNNEVLNMDHSGKSRNNEMGPKYLTDSNTVKTRPHTQENVTRYPSSKMNRLKLKSNQDDVFPRNDVLATKFIRT